MKFRFRKAPKPKAEETKSIGPVDADRRPMMWVDDATCPGIDKLNAGQTVHMVVKCKVEGVNVNDREGAKKTASANLRIVSGVIDTKDPKDYDEIHEEED